MAMKAAAVIAKIGPREKRTVAEVVERALEAYDSAQTGREPASGFYARLSRQYGVDLDLDAVVRDARRPHSGPEL